MRTTTQLRQKDVQGKICPFFVRTGIYACCSPLQDNRWRFIHYLSFFTARVIMHHRCTTSRNIVDKQNVKSRPEPLDLRTHTPKESTVGPLDHCSLQSGTCMIVPLPLFGFPEGDSHDERPCMLGGRSGSRSDRPSDVS
jgi:hypothetical protein